MTDVKKLTDEELDNLIENHRRHHAMEAPLYAAAMEEYEARYAPDLNLQTSLAYIKQAAAKRRFISYGELAEANGASWQKVRRPMNKHLWALIDYAHRQGWPVLSAIVVNKPNVETGEMDAGTLTGFVTAARALGHDITDEHAFLKEQQAACFAWGKRLARKKT